MTGQHLVTADELLRMSEDEARLELIAGVLVRSPHAPWLEAVAATNISHALYDFVGRHGPGEVLPGRVGCILRRDPDTVLAPDVCFIGRERLRGTPLHGFLLCAPDLVVEVLSEFDRPGAVAAKTQRWLAASARLVWNVDPEAAEVVAFEPGEEPRVYGAEDVLPGEPVLPGFSVRVADLLA